MEFELISTRDLFEDDDIVIISRIGKVFNAKVEIIDVAIKDENGDITSIMEVNHKILGYL